jgi:hypothetical protein
MGLMYSYGLFLIGRHAFGLDFSSLRSLIARWFFMAAITGRYSSSPESQMEEDLLRIRNLRTAAEFTQALEGVIQNTFTEDYWSITLPGELETSANRVPSLYAYYAALCLLDAKVLFSDLKVSDLLDPAIKSNKGSERHHLFPRGYLRRLGITDLQDTNQLANFALVEWSDNIDISDNAPSEYFPPSNRKIQWLRGLICIIGMRFQKAGNK